MQNENYDEFVKIMAAFSENVGCIISTVGYRAKFDALKADLTMDEFRQSARSLTRTWKYNRIPTGGVFIDAAKGEMEEIENRQAMLAWEKLITHLRRDGAEKCRKKGFDPGITFAVKMLGGWDALKNWKDDKIHFRQKEFEKAYLSFARLNGESVSIEFRSEPITIEPKVKKLISGIGGQNAV